MADHSDIKRMVEMWGLQIDGVSDEGWENIAKSIISIRDAERERCAKIVEHPNAGMVPPDGGAPTERERMKNIAADIRAGT